MALYKTQNFKNGTQTSYHRVSDIAMAVQDDKVQVRATISSYLDETHRRDSALNRINFKSINFETTKQEIINTPIITIVYQKAKEDEYFKDAIDC